MPSYQLKEHAGNDKVSDSNGSLAATASNPGGVPLTKSLPPHVPSQAWAWSAYDNADGGEARTDLFCIRFGSVESE